MKRNYWKSATIFLSIIAIFLLVYNLVFLPSQYYVFHDFNNFKIKITDFNSIKNTLQIGQQEKVCNMNDGNCILIGRIG